jgi:hypothetical protein
MRRLPAAILLAGSLAVAPAGAADDGRYGDDYQRCTQGSTVDIE